MCTKCKMYIQCDNCTPCETILRCARHVLNQISNKQKMASQCETGTQCEMYLNVRQELKCETGTKCEARTHV